MSAPSSYEQAAGSRLYLWVWVWLLGLTGVEIFLGY